MLNYQYIKLNKAALRYSSIFLSLLLIYNYSFEAVMSFNRFFLKIFLLLFLCYFTPSLSFGQLRKVDGDDNQQRTTREQDNEEDARRSRREGNNNRRKSSDRDHTEIRKIETPTEKNRVENPSSDNDLKQLEEEEETHKANRTTSGPSLFEFIGKNQKKAMEERRLYPYYASLEIPTYLGLNFQPGHLFNTGIRANWGVFSTEYRYSTLQNDDITTCTHDWQVLKLNILYKTFRLSGGTGFIYDPMEQNTEWEFTADAQLRLLDQKLTFIASRRGTLHGEDDIQYRSEWYFSADYEFYRYGSFHFAGLLGYISQQYYNDFYNEVLTAGLLIRIH